MLAYVLAIIVAIGSFTFYIAAFFVPELHRRQDFFWSGLGLFYGVVLWFCAGRLTGAVLLGQVVSVALLGGLGWHTLALRRDLTPDLVQTPITWQNLEQWAKDLQSLIEPYIQLEAVGARLKAAGAKVSQVWAQLRERSTSTQSANAASEVPPLKRSPAYEFETAPGTGQTVPSEFASVASRKRSPIDATIPTDQPPEPSESTAAAEVDAATSEPAGQTELANNASERSPKVVDQVAETEAPSSPGAALDSTTAPDTTDTVQPASAAATASTVAPSQPAASPPRISDSPAMGWLDRLTARFRQPKPQRTAIEIPLRPPSIPRSPQAKATSPPISEATDGAPKRARSSQSQRGVIDIPPRPPSIPRSSAARQSASVVVNNATPLANDEPNWDDTNWADTGDTPETAKSAIANSGDANRTTASESETNWPDSSASEVPYSASSAPSANDTNWPDDEDTNWPD